MSQNKVMGAKVQISKNGPYIVSGDVPLSKEIIGVNASGESIKWEQGQEYPSQEQYALCRCGHSRNKPFFEVLFLKTDSDFTESAICPSYIDQAKSLRCPNLSLTDFESLCAFELFRAPHGQV